MYTLINQILEANKITLNRWVDDPSIELVVDFLMDNPNPDSKDIKDFSIKNNIDLKKTNSILNFLAFKTAQLLRTGLMNKKDINREDVNQEQLEVGTRVEKEHTDCVLIAEKIALDHLAELPDYYTRLNRMEQKAKKEMNDDS